MNTYQHKLYVQKVLTKNFLLYHYITLNKTIYDIEKEFNIGKTSIGTYLKKYNLINLKSVLKFNNILTKDFLIKEYINNKKSTTIIAKENNTNRTTVATYLNKNNIDIRNKSERQLKELSFWYGKKKPFLDLSGSKAPNWQGGISNIGYSYRFNNKLKLKIRTRDNFICQNCNLTEKDHIRGNKQINLTVHHIDYNKKNCKQNNLITICFKCNVKANGYRDYWFAYYSYIINNYTKEILNYGTLGSH